MSNITVTINDKKYKYLSGTSLYDISKDFQSDFKNKIIVAQINGKIFELSKSVENNCSIEFYDNTSTIGNMVYENGLVFILIKSFKDKLNMNITIGHSIDKGICFETERNISNDDLNIVSTRMREIVKEDMIIEKVLVDRMDAINYYKKYKMFDKVNILKYTTNSNVNLYKLGNLYDYFFIDLPISTGYIDKFELTYIDKNSFVLNYPNIYSENKKMGYKHHEKLYNEFSEYSNWMRKLGINNISDINNKISNGDYSDIILISESFFNNKLYSIAQDIYNNSKIKMVLISGPSSSGKTTTSKKLKLYLKSFGLNPISISVDDYFVNRENTPKKEDGSYDFECVDAINLKLFNEHLSKLLNGESVKIPTYNFILGKPEYINDSISLNDNEILIIEGLHAINDRLTESIDKKNKYKIYLSPLTSLNLDNHNRIKTTDNRLLRRIIRDFRTRGYSASDTLELWKNVRIGEEKNVFPIQDEVDIVFNTSLLYELNVLKTYVEPLLYSVSEDDKNYNEAVRLLNLLRNILPIPSDIIPKDSIIREFIGNSHFSN